LWTVVGGSIVFGVGLISAFEARKQRKPMNRDRIVVRGGAVDSAKKNKSIASQMSMAASGVANGEENLASFGSGPR